MPYSGTTLILIMAIAVLALFRGGTLGRAVRSWLAALALGLGTGVLLGGGCAKGVFIGVAPTGTALGTVLPVLRDAGVLHGRFGPVVMAFGAVGEFGPIIAMALLLGGRAPAESAVPLGVLAALTAAAVFWALRPRPPRFSRIIAKALHGSGQFAVRFVFLVLALKLRVGEEGRPAGAVRGSETW
ncbi:cation:proton antiporter [Streptomyces narbonensis]|uniref:Cation:proton antiporter n=1 Tax=Streptomyces narbonensis TaxID=67333 RepID=A0ABV3C403_9ACTN